MSTVQLLIICITVLALAGIVLSRAEPRRSPGRSIFADLYPGERVAAHLEGSQSIEGVVSDWEDGHLTLRDAKLLSGGASTAMGGLVRVPERGVIAVQELEGEVVSAKTVTVRRNRPKEGV